MMEARRTTHTATGSLRHLTKREIDGMIADVAQHVAESFQDVTPVRMTYLGEEIYAIPLDTRRFIRVMSRYISLN